MQRYVYITYKISRENSDEMHDDLCKYYTTLLLF